MSEKGWKFPSSGGGVEGGFNDSGIETYAGNPFESLAREIIQNSLDARASGDLVNPSPVRVSFELAEVPQGDFPGHGEILDAMQKCRKASKGEKKAEKFFARAEQILKGAVINCLKVLDYGTTGLCDGKGDDLKTGQWHRLVKATGRSAKDSNTAGGSYGIGKNAPFAVSELRTVFYSTRCKDSGGRVCEMAQGKAILVSHDLKEGGDSQPVGFYGWKEKDGEKLARLTGNDIPKLLRRNGDEEGTTLLIPGLSETAAWQEKIIAAVISNYFYAIDKGELEVLIDGAPDAYSVIDAKTLPHLLADKKIQESGEGVKKAYYYHRAIQEGEVIEAELSTLGYCVLWLLVKEECPKSVAILRRGMKITDRSTGLIHWGDSFSDFVAVCICKSDKGNALLRRMENPAHDAFEPARLLEDNSLGERALRELAKWVRDQVKELAQEKISEVKSLSRMAKFFSAPDDTLPGENAEKDFDGGSSVKIKPTKIAPAPADDIDDEEDGPGEDEGDFPGDGPGGDGPGGGGKGGGKGKKRRSEVPMEIEAVRVISMSDEAHKRVMLTPRQTGAAALFLRVAGDSFTEDIDIAEVLDGNCDKIDDGKVLLRVVAGKRLSLKVRLVNPFSGSLSVILGKQEKKKDEVDS